MDKANKLKMATNMMYVATDIANGYAHSVEQLLKDNKMYRNSDKNTIKRIKHLASILVSSVHKTLKDDNKIDNYEDDSDFIKEVIELACETRTEDDHIRLLSAMKLSIKPIKQVKNEN